MNLYFKVKGFYFKYIANLPQYKASIPEFPAKKKFYLGKLKNSLSTFKFLYYRFVLYNDDYVKWKRQMRQIIQ
ncbi:unnamed protein product [Onchocerca flexuosa]|uniref:Uncharacterized protein n=1 Tax=Onchocerca flexuosa TaxID=387005 RepID=A0A183HS53_9BILA|nr:unnamed protein product [Onchocerca flexuosa]